MPAQSTATTEPTAPAPRVRERWECRCDEPAVLLGKYKPGSHVEIKVGDRHYQASGCIHATCPRCGAMHILDLRPEGSA